MTIDLASFPISGGIPVSSGANTFGGTVNAPAYSLYGGNEQTAVIQQASELLTVAAAATSDTTLEVPAGCLILGVSARVTVAVTCTSTFDVGTSGTANLFLAAVSKAANTTAAKAPATYVVTSAATKLRVTPDTTPSDATGRVRLTVTYISLTAPTS